MINNAPYGSWPSDITTSLMTSGAIGLSETRLFEGTVYWLESRPQEQGRTVIVRQNLQNGVEELIPAEYSSRTRVHEYGGACYLPTSVGLFFVNQEDQQIYKVDASLAITRLTNAPDVRFADLVFNKTASSLVAVAEEHSEKYSEPRNSLVSVDLLSGEIQVLHEGQHFYASPCISDDDTQLAWLSWMHPNMPWDGTLLWRAKISDDGITEAVSVVGGDAESVFQPQWSPSGVLYYVSDKTNWWNIYRLNNNGSEAVYPMQAEFGLPLWQFGMTRYGFLDSHTILTSYSSSGIEKLAVINTLTGELTDIKRPHSGFSSLRTESGRYCYIAQSTVEFPAVFTGDLDTETLVCSSSSVEINQANYSIAEPVTFSTAGNTQAHGFFYRPLHAEYRGSDDELPPLLVMIHGGPTSATSDSLSFKIQFWTNRGFAVLDVNYRGSTGFGRQYRDALKTQWGIADVEDCDYGVRHLIEKGLVDKNRVAIRGGSAGGFTVLAALAATETFKAGTSLYGVTDLTALATDTHKFESRYLDSLIGPYPEEKALYESRSPSNHADSITAPVLFLQGEEDKVVPPSQAELMIDKLKINNTPVAYLLFEGEAHGFRKSETIKQALAAELGFYGSVFGFEPAGESEVPDFL